MMTPPTADGDPDLLFICSDGEEQQQHLMGEDQQELRWWSTNRVGSVANLLVIAQQQ